MRVVVQWMDHEGWYDRKIPYPFRKIINIQFVGAMGPPGGGRNPLSQRFQRHFNILSFTDLSNESLMIIFGSILGKFLEQGFNDLLMDLKDALVTATVEIYQAIQESMLPTPAKSHYTFNLR